MQFTVRRFGGCLFFLTNSLITLNVYGHILKDSMGSIQRALDETYADMRSGEGTQKQDLPSAS